MPLADATVEILADTTTFSPQLRAGLRKAAAVAGREADRGFGRITDAARGAAADMAGAYEDAAGETVTALRSAATRGGQALTDLGDTRLNFDFAGPAVAGLIDTVETGAGRAREALTAIGRGGDLGLGSAVAAETARASAAVAGLAADVTGQLSGLGAAGRTAGADLAGGLESGLAGAASAGRAAGNRLADGVEAGARGIQFDRAFDDLDAEAETAGKEAGRSLADSISGVLATAGIGAGLGASLAATLDVSTATDTLRAQIGATPAETARYGKLAGELFAQNYGGSIGEVTGSMAVLMQQLPQLRTASDSALAGSTKDALNFSRAFGVDTAESARGVASILRNGLAPDAEAAFDVLTKGFRSSANGSGDLIDTFNDYGPQFKSLGLSAEDSLGLLNQMVTAGARNSDLAGDSIRSFTQLFNQPLATMNGEGVAAPTAVGKAFADMGFDISQAAAEAGTGAYGMQKDLAAGGDRAREAFAQILPALSGIEDPTARSAAAVALFGDQAQDLGDSLYAANLNTAATDLGKVSGAAANLDPQGAAAGMGAFTRSLQTLGTSVGQTVLPSLTGLVDSLKGVTGFLTEHKDIAGPMMTGLLGIASAGAGIKAVKFGVEATGLPGAVKGVANLSRGMRGLESAEGLMGKIGGSLRSLGGAGKTAEGSAGALSRIADKAKAAGTAMGSAAGTAADYGKKLGGAVGRGAAIAADTAKLVAQKAVMAGIKVATAAWTAAQWLLNVAMNANPLGLVVLAVVALVAIIFICYKKFDSFREIVDKAWQFLKGLGAWLGDFFVKAWGKIVDTLGEVGGKIGGFFTGLWGKIVGWLGDIGGKLKTFFVDAFGKVWDAYVAVITTWYGFWFGLPGKIIGWLGDIGGKLKTFFVTAFGKLWDVYVDLATQWYGFWSGLAGKIIGWLGDIGGKIAGVFRASMSAVGTAVSGGWTATANFFSGIGGRILSLLGSVGNAVTTPFRTAWASAKTFVSNGITGVMNLITGLPGRIGAVAGKLYDAGKNLIGKFISGLGNIGNSALNFGAKIVSFLKGKLNSGIGTVNKYVDAVNDKIPGSFADIPHIPTLGAGDIVRRATLAVVGEAGPEVVIPLTRPARAEELARRSGLIALLELRGLLAATPTTPAAGAAGSAGGYPGGGVGGGRAAYTDRSVHIGALHVHHNGTDSARATEKALYRAARLAMS